MAFLSAELLLFLLIAPLLPALYVWALRRKKPTAMRFSNMGLIKAALGERKNYRRHVPPILIFLAVLIMIGGMARPSAVLTLPSERSTVILAIDVSGSMRAADVPPNRMTVAKAAAKAFVETQPRNARIGLVAFSTSAMITQDPTLVHGDVIAAIEGLRPQRFTAVGSGIVASLQAIFPDTELDLPDLDFVRDEPRAVPLDEREKNKEPAEKNAAVAPGSNKSAVIVLLSDGRTNMGVEPLDAARMAADRGVRIFTVGFGTQTGGMVDFGGGGFMRTQLDEVTLKAIAEITGAKYFHAQTEVDLKNVYDSLSTQFVSETKRTEVSAAFAAAALLLMLLAAGLSVAWSNRAPA
jgi:Ca-activated chloride channel family protein